MKYCFVLIDIVWLLFELQLGSADFLQQLVNVLKWIWFLFLLFFFYMCFSIFLSMGYVSVLSFIFSLKLWWMFMFISWLLIGSLCEWPQFIWCDQQAYVYYGFGPLTFCLSVNYMDRFLSVYELPVRSIIQLEHTWYLWMSFWYNLFGFVGLFSCSQRGKAWTMQLLAVACLSLAAKVEETHVPQSVDLQV